MSNFPKVSCIMPTADRHKFIPQAVHYFINQDYEDAELVIIDDSSNSVKNLIPNHNRVKYFQTKKLGKIGLKRNYAAAKSKGEIIMHWDDDDYYGVEWITRSLKALETSKADISGLNEFLFFSPLENKFWTYKDDDLNRPYLAGATMVYHKSFWQKHPFRDLQIGEDYDYVWNNNAAIYAHDYTDGFVATLHGHNTTLKPFENPHLKKFKDLYLDPSIQLRPEQ